MLEIKTEASNANSISIRNGIDLQHMCICYTFKRAQVVVSLFCESDAKIIRSEKSHTNHSIVLLFDDLLGTIAPKKITTNRNSSNNDPLCRVTMMFILYFFFHLLFCISKITNIKNPNNKLSVKSIHHVHFDDEPLPHVCVFTSLYITHMLNISGRFH